MGRSTVPLLILLLLILGASGYITSLVMNGDQGEGQFIYPKGPGRELLPAVPAHGKPPTEAVAMEVRIEIRPLARLLAVADEVELPLRLSYAGKAYPARAESVAGSWCSPGRARGGRNLIRITLPGGGEIFRILDLPAAGGGVLDLRLEGPAALRGRVLDADGNPLKNASVWGGLADPAEASAWLPCDRGGAFEIELPLSGRGLPVVARANGFASSFRVLQVDGSARDGIDVHLDVATSLEVQLAAILADPEAGRLYLRPASGETRLRGYPFFLQQSGLPFDAQGRCLISDLPIDANLELVLSHAQVILPGATSVRVGRRANKIIMQVPRAAMIRGRVLDANGEPLFGATVHSLGAVAGWVDRSTALLPQGALDFGEAMTTSDSTGAFSIAYIPPDSSAWLIRVRAEGYWGTEMEISTGQARVQQDFVLEPMTAAGQEPSLRFHMPGPGRRVIRMAGRSWHAWPEGEAFVQPLREAALVDVVVRVRSRKSGIEREQLFSRVLVASPTDLEISIGK